MNKFEQMSSDHHQMSLAGNGAPVRGWGSSGWVCPGEPRGNGYVQGGVGPNGGMSRRGWGWVCPEGQGRFVYHVTYPTMHVIPTPTPTPMDRMTDTCENITRTRNIPVECALPTCKLYEPASAATRYQARRVTLYSEVPCTGGSGRLKYGEIQYIKVMIIWGPPHL